MSFTNHEWWGLIHGMGFGAIVVYYGTQLVRHERVRRTSLGLYVLAFAFAAVAGAFGAFLTKIAPVT